MKRKHFILALVAMLWSVSFSAFAGDVIVVNNETELRAALAASGVQRTTGLRRAAAQQSTDAQSNDAQLITFGSDVTLTAPFETNVGGNYVLDLEGYALRGAAIDDTKHQYPFYNRGTLIIKDSQGGGYIDCGVYNGYDTDGVTYSEARLEMVSGKIVCHDDEGAAIINYGTTIISGGSVEGSVNALKNVSGTMTVAAGVSITGEVAGEVTISTDVKFTVAKIGDNVYATFGEALAAANAMTGDVTMQIFGEVEFTDGMELNGSYTSINFVGKSAKAKMTVNQTAGGDYLTAHGKTVTFTDLTLAKANPAWQGNSGHMSQYFSIQGGTVTYTNCTFLNGACTSGGTATYTDCTFQNAEGQYGLWVYDDALVTVNGGTIDSKRGIKVYSEDEASVTTTLTVQNATFTENVTAKPAVAIGYAESITLIGNTYNNTTGVLELDSGSDADCEGITFVAQDENGNDISSTITATDRSNSDAACGVLVDGKIYTTVTEAVKDAEAGDKVTVLYSTTEEVTFTKGVELELANGVIAENVTVVPDYLYTYAEFNALIKQNGSYDGTVEGTLVVLKDSERSYQNNKTAQFFIGATNVNITDPVETVNVTGVTFEFVDDDETNAYTSGELQIFAKNIAFTNCTFKGTAVSPWGKSNSENAETATFTNCTWKDLSGRYGVHQNRASNLTVTGCTFENCERGIHTNSSTVAAITITNNTFTGIGDGYGAICLAENGNVGNATLNITGNKAEGQVFLRQLNANTTYAQVTEILNTEKNTYGTAYVSGSTEIQPPVAQIGTTTYTSLQAAIDAVKNGDEIILVADCDEAIAFTQTKDVSFVLNGNDKTMTGSINITARAGKDAPSTLVIKNFNFETDEISHDFIKSVETNYYPNNITIQDCTFKGTSDINTEGYAVVAVRLKSANNITIKGCTGTGLHSFLQNTAGWNVTIDDVDITNSLSGFAMGTVQGTAIKNCDIKVQESGIRLDAQYNNNAVIADNKIEAFIPVVVRKASVDGNITFSGDNNFTATNFDGLWCAIGTSEYKENGTLPTDATAKIKVSLNGTGLTAEGIYGNFVPAAKIGEIEYATLADAIAAAKAGDVVKVFAGTYAVPTMKAGITIEGEVDSEGKSTVLLEGTLMGTLDNLTLKNLHIKGDNAQRWAYANGNLVFENVTFEATSVYAIHFDGIKEGATLLYKNCTIIGWAALGGSPESCKFEGCTIKDNGTYGVIRTYFDTEIKDCTFDVANAKTDDVYQDGIHVVGDAEATVDGCTNTNGEMKELVNISGKSVVVLDGVEIKNFAKIGDTHYQSFAEALNAVQAGETITLIRDVTVAEGESAEINGFNLTAEEGVKLINNGTVTVTGEAASLNIATFEGNPIELRNGKLVDSNIGANAKAETNTVNAFGTNNISGTTKIGGILSLGYLTNPTEQVVVNITGNFNGTNVLVRTNNGVDNLLNVGAADGERTTAHFGQLGGFADVNITNADVTYGYAFIRNDLNVTNSALEIKDGVNTYFAGNAKVVIDNSTWSLPGYANIGSYGGYNYGNADVTLKNGSSITATNLGVELEEGKEVKLTLEDTSSLTATKLSNQGSIVLASTEATITANSGVSNITTTVADYKLAYVDGAYKVVAKDYVAYIGEQGYESLAEALIAAADGAIVSLSWAEGDPAITMNGSVFGKNVTITGTAKVDWSKGWLYVGRGGEGNATVTFDNANLTSASSNSNSGLGIHVSGREKDTDNKYDGTLVIRNSTIALDYLINRGAITVDGATLTVKNGFGIAGRPASETESGADATATITLENNAKLVVNNHQGMGLGQAAAQLEGYGVMNVNSGSTFETTQAFYVSAKGQMNVNGGTVKITGNLTNNGTVYVAGASTLDATVAGDGWFYMNGVTLGADTKLLGAKVAFINGENTVKGSTFKDGWFSVGIGQNAAAATAAAFAQANGITLGDVTVNVSENANIGGNGEAYSGWVGSAYSADKTQHTYALNVENSQAAFGYMHVSKDGTLTVDGRSAENNRYTYDNANVNFYAGDFIINGLVTLNNADAWVKYTKMSVDHVGGVLNINGDTKYESSIHNGSNTGTSLVYYNSGKVNVAETAIVEIDNATNFVDGAELNIAGNVTAKGAITGNGAINFTNDAATLTTATTGLTIGYDLDADKKVVYADGAYKVVDKLYVAQTDAAMYESLQEAIENVADNGTVTLLSDVTVTEAAYGQNALNHARAINFTLDLNGKKLSADTGNSVFRFNITGSGATSDVTVTVKNGTVVSGANTWCTLMASGISVDVKAVMNLEDLTIENYKGGDFAVKAWANGVVNAKNVTINASYGGGFYALGGEIVLDNCTVEQKGLWTAPYNSMTIGVSDGGKMTVNSGTYSAVPADVADGNNQGTSHGSWCGGVMSSGGTLIINGGNFSNGNIGGTASNPRELFIVGADADYGDNVAARLEINGGTFNSIGALTHCETIWGSENDAANTYMPTMDVVITAGDFTGVAGKTIGGCDPISTGNPVDVVISGGTYSANHAIDNSYLADAYIIVDNGNSTYTVSNGTVKVGETYYASLEAGLKALTDGATLTFIEDITVTEAWDCRYNGAKVTAANVTIDGNGKTLKIAGAVDDRNWNTVFRFEGDNATVKNLTIDASAATGIDRGITSKLSVTVDKCTLIGNGTSAKRAIIFGEGAGSSISNVVATVTNSTFKNWSYGVSDNQNAQDAKNVTVAGNIFENASVLVSASDQVVFSNNTLNGGGVSITSYTNVEGVSVTAFNNMLDADEENEITTNPARHMISGEGFSKPVAKMNGKYYVSIQKAVNASATGSEITLTVNSYLDMDEAVVIEGKVVTLNLNGKIVRATADAQMTGGIFRLLDGADLTITGEGEINYNGNANVYAAVGILGAANLTVENSKLVGYYYGITGNGMKDGSTITINGGEISSVEGTGSGIYHPQNGTLTVTGGTITGATGIYFKSGVLNITNGTINGTGAKVAYGHNGNGSDATGDALVIENVAAGNYEAVTSVAVTGGSFNSVNADPIASYAADGATALTQFVTGGTFNKTFSEECLPVGYQLKDYDSNGYYNVELTNTRESMTFVDGEFTEYTIATDMNIGTLTYKRANVPTTWAAFYFPFEVPVSQLAEQGFEVAYINGVRRNDTDFDGELDKFVMEVIYIHGGETCDGSGKTLRANYPYFIRAKEEAKDLEIVLKGATLYAAKNATYDCTTFTEKFEITGNTSQVSINSTNDRLIYAVSTVGEWTNITKGATLKPFRFYMALTSRYENEPIAPVATMSIAVRGEEREDGTTFIYDVEMDGGQNIDYIYDLQGRRVLEPQKGGLYIVNGKKVLF